MPELSIKQICTKYNLSPVYVRRSLLNGKLHGRKVEIMNNTFKWLIDEDEVKRWRSTRSNSGRRKDGRNKFNLYATSKELEQLKKVLKENNVELPLRRSNKSTK